MLVEHLQGAPAQVVEELRVTVCNQGVPFRGPDRQARGPHPHPRPATAPGPAPLHAGCERDAGAETVSI